MENPIKMDDLGVYTPIFGNIHMFMELFFSPIHTCNMYQYVMRSHSTSV